MREVDPATRIAMGGKPTARERWQAFHRLYRLSRRGHHWHLTEAGTAWRILFPGCWRWVQLEECHGDDLDCLRFMPVPVRQHRVRRLRHHREAVKRRVMNRLLNAIFRDPAAEDAATTHGG